VLGLSHYKARFYSPALGRFLQADPIGYKGGINLYAYAANNPVNRLDPFGLEPLPPVVQEILKPFFASQDLSQIDIQLNVTPPIVTAGQFFFGGVTPIAITRGNVIYFPEATNYRPDTIAGIALIGHEIQHSVQYAQNPLFDMSYALSYTRNRANGMNHDQAYRSIPQEAEAYAMQDRIQTTLSGTQSAAPIETRDTTHAGKP
jgi:uncharacterized protein RhaS with RHS repeats